MSPPVCCPKHSNARLIDDDCTGDRICSKCGFVVLPRVVDGGSTKDNSRVGAAENLLLEGEGLFTGIAEGPGMICRDEFGKPMYGNRRRTRSSSLNAYHEMKEMADHLHLPKTIVDAASRYFKKVHDVKGLKDHSSDAITSACMYIACRQEGAPRTFKEICAVSTISKKEIGRISTLIKKNLKISLKDITAGDFMPRFCFNLGLPPSVQKAATQIARKAVKMNLVPRRSPISVIAAAIYIASRALKEKKTQKEIGEIAGVATGTIRQSYKSMNHLAADLFPTGF